MLLAEAAIPVDCLWDFHKAKEFEGYLKTFL
jgi:hypothetical protein